MISGYAKDQPAGFKNRVENVAIVGASGTIGKHFTSHLLQTGLHKVTAITRTTSTSSFPTGVNVVKVDYADPSTLTSALTGQDALIITMPARAGPSTEQEALIAAAAEANVPWVFPNEYGYWVGEQGGSTMAKDTFVLQGRLDARRQIEELGKSRWIAFTCGFWYDFSLGQSPHAFGFDFKGREVAFVDDGRTRINAATFPQCGRAMAKVLSLKVLPEDEGDQSPHLAQFGNDFLFVSSFLVSQKDMFESVLRVTETKAEDWKVGYEDHKERYEAGMALMQSGNRAGFVQVMYTRVMYPTDNGNFEDKYGTANEILGLPKEDLDEWTKSGIELGLSDHKAY